MRICETLIVGAIVASLSVPCGGNALAAAAQDHSHSSAFFIDGDRVEFKDFDGLLWTATARAECPTNRLLISGGYKISNLPADIWPRVSTSTLVASYFASVEIYEEAPNAKLTVWAICGPVRTRPATDSTGSKHTHVIPKGTVETEEVTLKPAAGSTGTWTVCPKGRAATSSAVQTPAPWRLDEHFPSDTGDEWWVRLLNTDVPESQAGSLQADETAVITTMCRGLRSRKTAGHGHSFDTVQLFKTRRSLLPSSATSGADPARVKKAIMRCPAGYQALSAGYFSASDSFQYRGSEPKGRRMKIHYVIAPGDELHAYVYCISKRAR